MKKFFVALALICASSSVFASGRDLVDTVEADTVEAALVNRLISTFGLRCERPNLISQKNVINSVDFKIKQMCRFQDDSNAKIEIGGTIEDSQVTITNFNLVRYPAKFLPLIK